MKKFKGPMVILLIIQFLVMVGFGIVIPILPFFVLAGTVIFIPVI